MSALRHLPKVDPLSQSPRLASYPEKVRIQAAREAIAELRASIQSGAPLPLESAEALAEAHAERLNELSLRPAINLSGVVLHTGLGRARLAPSAVEAVRRVAASHSTLEFDVETGHRGDRQAHVRAALCELTGAEDAHVLNNAAGAVFLALQALCAGREVILSRGQMVEIGGSFRMPDIVRSSGCRLVEVGCTNKTHLHDYENAITEDTAAILRCHPSNFKIIGFVKEPSVAEIAEVARKSGVRMIDDQGNACLVDTTRYGLPKQGTLQESVAAGSDLIVASGDKMLGATQAGLVLGKKEAVAAVRKHPLARALRVDKLTLAAIEATLKLYQQGRELEIPIHRYLARTPEEIRPLAMRIKKAYPGDAALEEGLTEVGGGSAPGSGIPTWRVGLASPEGPEVLARRLRSSKARIMGRIERDRVWLDPRTLDREELPLVEQVLRNLG